MLSQPEAVADLVLQRTRRRTSRPLRHQRRDGPRGSSLRAGAPSHRRLARGGRGGAYAQQVVAETFLARLRSCPQTLRLVGG